MAYLEKEEIKNPLQEKLARKVTLPLARLSDGKLAIGQAREILDEMDDKVKCTTNPGELRIRQCIREHTLALGSSVALLSSDFHNNGTFARDAVDACLIADSSKLAGAVLDLFADVQDLQTGAMPTSRFAFSRGGHTLNDESTARLIFLSWYAKEELGLILSPEQERAISQGLDYLNERINPIGQVASKGGENGIRRAYWADELVLPGKGDMISNVQGWVALALESGIRMGFSTATNQELLKKVEDEFRHISSANSGRQALSLLNGLVDVTALEPECMANYYFDKKLLDDGDVKNTIASFRSGAGGDGLMPDLGLRVITAEDGRYLSERSFIHPNVVRGEFMNNPGNYQNGATWLDKDYEAWACARYHEIDLGFLPDHMQRVFNGETIMKNALDNNFPEFLPTSRGAGEFMDPRRTGHIWYGKVWALQRKLHTVGIPEIYTRS